MNERNREIWECKCPVLCAQDEMRTRTVNTKAHIAARNSSAQDTAKPLMYLGPSVAGKRWLPRMLPHWPIAMYIGMPAALFVSEPRLYVTAKG